MTEIGLIEQPKNQGEEKEKQKFFSADDIPFLEKHRMCYQRELSENEMVSLDRVSGQIDKNEEIAAVFEKIQIDSADDLMQFIDAWFDDVVFAGTGGRRLPCVWNEHYGKFVIYPNLGHTYIMYLLEHIGSLLKDHSDKVDREQYSECYQYFIKRSMQALFPIDTDILADEENRRALRDTYDDEVFSFEYYQPEFFIAQELLQKYGKYANREIIDEVAQKAIRYGHSLMVSAYFVFVTDRDYSHKVLSDAYQEALRDPQFDDYHDLFRESHSPEDTDIRLWIVREMMFRLALDAPGYTGVEETKIRDLYSIVDFNYEKDAFIARISGNGDIGVFDKAGRLDRYANMSDWNWENSSQSGFWGTGRELRPKIREISIEQFFQGVEEMSLEERRRLEDVLERFKMEYLPFCKQYPMERLGAEIANASIREQIWFINFFLDQDEDGRVKVIKLIKVYGEAGLRSLALTGVDQDQTKKLLAFSANAPSLLARELFFHVANWAELSAKIDAQILSFFPDEEIDIRARNQVVRELEGQAVRVLTAFLAKYQRSRSVDQTELYKELKEIKSEAVLFAAVCRTAHLKGELRLEDITETQIESKKAEALGESEKQELYKFFRRARRDYEDSEIIEKDIAAFKHRLDNHGEQTKVYSLKHQGELIAFVRFDQNEDGTVHAASLNNTPDANNANIGMSFLEQTLEKEARDHVVVGEVALMPFLIDNYLRMGFILDGVEVDPNDGEILFHMKKNNNLNKELEKTSATEYEEIAFDFSKDEDKQQLASRLKKMFERGMVVRRGERGNGRGRMNLRFEQFGPVSAVAA